MSFTRTAYKMAGRMVKDREFWYGVAEGVQGPARLTSRYKKNKEIYSGLSQGSRTVRLYPEQIEELESEFRKYAGFGVGFVSSIVAVLLFAITAEPETQKTIMYAFPGCNFVDFIHYISTK